MPLTTISKTSSAAGEFGIDDEPALMEGLRRDLRVTG
jgi:hypothetical protein